MVQLRLSHKRGVASDELGRQRALAGPTGADEHENQWRSARSLFEQRLALLGTETLEAAAVADADRLHEAAGLDLAEAGKGLENGDHFHLADGLVGVRLSEELRQRKVGPF